MRDLLTPRPALRRGLLPALSVALAALAAATSVAEGPPPPVPRAVLFGNPEKTLPRLSPDGSVISWLAADSGGVLNVWAAPSGADKPRLVTNEAHRPVSWYDWAPDSRHILYLHDQDGDEIYHLFSADLETGVVRDLTPFRGIRAQNVLTSGRRPGVVLVAMNLRDRRVFDMYRVDLATGAVTLEAENPGDVLTWSTD